MDFLIYIKKGFKSIYYAALCVRGVFLSSIHYRYKW